MSSWPLTIAALAIVFVVGVTCSPIDISVPATELLPPRDESVGSTSDLPLTESTLANDLLPPNDDVLPTLATDLLPPKIGSESTYDSTGIESARINDVPTPATELLPPLPSTLATELIPPPEPKHHFDKKIPATLFLINVFAVKNHTAEDSNDVLHNDVMKEVDSDESSSEPLAMFLLVVEDEEESNPVSLDDVAKDLEAEGFNVEKIRKDGDTRIIKVDLSSVMSKSEEDSRSNAIERVERELAKREIKDSEEGELEESGELLKIRRKRHLCLKCKLEEIKQRKYGGGGGCRGGCGGGGGYYPSPPIYQPPVYQPQPPIYNPPPVYHPPPQYCNTCQGGGGGYGHGGGNSFSQASAQASASASSYGK